MQMFYNSENYAVVRFDVPALAVDGAAYAEAVAGAMPPQAPLQAHGGYEIVDKLLRKEIYIHGALAESFKMGVEKLIESEPTEADMDAYIEGYASLMQQPLVFH